MPITQRNKIGMLEAMLFANAEPVETDRLAEAMRADPAEVLTLLEKLQKRYDETESGLMLLHFDGDRWQMATRPYYGEGGKRILDNRRDADDYAEHSQERAHKVRLYRKYRYSDVFFYIHP